MASNTYETDFYAWANEQAALLRGGKSAVADLEHIAEEIESLGKGEKREFYSRLTVLLLHLLKWRFQPKGRGASWEASIRVQRNRLARHLADNPSLKPLVFEALKESYEDAVLDAIAETGLPKSIYPTTCPFSFDEIMQTEFWPD